MSYTLQPSAAPLGLFWFMRFYSLALLLVRTRWKGEKCSPEGLVKAKQIWFGLFLHCNGSQFIMTNDKWHGPWHGKCPELCLDPSDAQTKLLQVPACSCSEQGSNTLSTARLFLLPLGSSKSIFHAHAMKGKCIKEMHLLLNHTQVGLVGFTTCASSQFFPFPFPPFLSTPRSGLPV